MHRSHGTAGTLEYLSLPPNGQSGVMCNGTPCSTVLVRGLINPALYKIGDDPASYAADFFDVTTGNDMLDPTVAATPRRLGGIR